MAVVILGWMKVKIHPIGRLFRGRFLHTSTNTLLKSKNRGMHVGSIYEQIYVLKMFDRWLKRTGREVQDLNEAVAGEFLRRVVKRGYAKNAAPSTLRRLIGNAPPDWSHARSRTQSSPSPSEQLTCGYERFLLEERNLVPANSCSLRRYCQQVSV